MGSCVPMLQNELIDLRVKGFEKRIDLVPTPTKVLKMALKEFEKSILNLTHVKKLNF